MDVQIRYRGKGCGDKKFDKNNLNCILPQALSQSCGESSRCLDDLPKQFDVKSYRPYTCREVRKSCMPLHTQYERNLGPQSFLTPLLYKNVCSLLSSNEEFRITMFPKTELSIWTEVAERQKMYFNVAKRKSYLPRMYGLYSYKEHKKEKIYFTVTNNVLPDDLEINERYSLKGCMARSRDSPTLRNDVAFRDLYKDRLVITQQEFNHIYEILKQDCEFLCYNNLVNYYLFIAIHEVSNEPTQTKFKVGNDTVNDHILCQDDFGLIGLRSRGILAKHTKTDNEGKVQGGTRTLLLFIGIMGNLKQYTTLRWIGRNIGEFLNRDNSWRSPVEYKDRFLEQFRQHWFRYEANEETKL